MESFAADLVSQPGHSIRRGERRLIHAAGQCRRGTMRETVEILDISVGGARVSAVAPLRTGYSVWIKLPGIEAQEARVAWTRGFESGCEFVRPLHPAVLDSLIGTRMASQYV